MSLTLSHTGTGKYADGFSVYDAAIITSKAKTGVAHLASMDAGTFAACGAPTHTATARRMWVGGIDVVTCKRCLKVMTSAGPAAPAIGDRYKPVRVETGADDYPWRVWDHHTGAFLKTAGGDMITYATKDASVRLANLMNERVGWPKEANVPAPVTMEHRGCHVCGKSTIRTAWHATKDANGADVRVHDKCDSGPRTIEYGADPTFGGSKFGPVVLDASTPETALQGTVSEPETVPATQTAEEPVSAVTDAVSGSLRYSAANTGGSNVYGVYDNETDTWQTRVGESYAMAAERADAMNEREGWFTSYRSAEVPPVIQPTYKGKTAGEWRQMAADSRKRSADSFERCDTDGFVSQWGSDLMAREHDLSAQLAETNGATETIGLFDLDGNLVDALHGWGTYGEYWMLLDSNGVKVGFFSPSKAKNADKRIANDARKGYYVGRVTVKGIAKIQGSGTGLSGAASCYATITPYSAKRTAETVITVIDNGQPEAEISQDPDRFTVMGTGADSFQVWDTINQARSARLFPTRDAAYSYSQNPDSDEMMADAPVTDRWGSLIAIGQAVMCYRTATGTPERATVVRYPLPGRVTVDHGPSGYAAPYDRKTEVLWADQLSCLPFHVCVDCRDATDYDGMPRACQISFDASLVDTADPIDHTPNRAADYPELMIQPETWQ